MAKLLVAPGNTRSVDVTSHEALKVQEAVRGVMSWPDGFVTMCGQVAVGSWSAPEASMLFAHGASTQQEWMLFAWQDMIGKTQVRLQ